MRITARQVRLGAAFSLAAAVLWATIPYAANYVSSQAVVNAPLQTVLSPLQGRITQRSPAAGTGIAPGAPLISVAVEERDHRFLDGLRARLTLIEESLASVVAEMEELHTLERVMTRRIDDYRGRMIARLAAERREAEAALAAAEAKRENARTNLIRAEALLRQGHATATRTDAETAAHGSAVAEVDQALARLDRLAVEADAVAAGVFVQDGRNDVPYSQQRLDGIALQLAGLMTERRRLAGERAALTNQIAGEERLVAARQTFAPEAAVTGVIWKESGAMGETVAPGDTLVQMVDCSARFVEVTLAERHFNSIEPGALASVRLKGGGAPVSARVSAVLGAGAKFDHPRLAAAVTEAKPDQLRVLVSLDGTGIDGKPGAFCHVGRTAEVRFERADVGQIRAMISAAAGRLGDLLGGPAAALPQGSGG